MHAPALPLLPRCPLRSVGPYKLMDSAKSGVRYRVSEKKNKIVKCIQFLMRAPSLLYVFSLSVKWLYDRLALKAGRSGMRCPLVYKSMVPLRLRRGGIYFLIGILLRLSSYQKVIYNFETVLNTKFFFRLRINTKVWITWSDFWGCTNCKKFPDPL